MALDTSLTFCAAITEIERWAAYDFTSSTVPTEADGEQYAYDVASVIVYATSKWGSRKAPPGSGISDAHLRRILAMANAIGAAYYLRRQIFTLSGDQRSLIVAQGLRGDWQTYMGAVADTVQSGLPSLQIGVGGLIELAITDASGSRLLITPVSEGDAELEDLTTKTQAPPFADTDRD